jgi:hypothetical protein
MCSPLQGIVRDGSRSRRVVELIAQTQFAFRNRPRSTLHLYELVGHDDELIGG